MTVQSPEAVAVETALWLETYSEASEDLKQASAAAAEAAWLGFDQWYNTAAVAALAAESADMSFAAQQIAAGLAQQYAVNVTAATSGLILPTQNPRPWREIRNGVNLRLVHHRPAVAYKRAISKGATHDEALVLAGMRAKDLVLSDVSLEERLVTQATLADAGIDHFRRVIRPELSKTGSCGLCIVAADRIYNTGDLMPIHPPSCKCVVMPIVGDNDPGGQMNREDLDALYAAAGSNKAADLRRTRYAVHEHGELGPVLTKADDSFRGPDKVALEDDPARAARMLEALLPTLERLEAAGGPAGPLAYQREQVARLRRIVGN